MAIYHLSGSVISRSAGKSAVASAAYRSGEKMVDERQERVADYTRKQDVAYKEILLPENAPAWMANREKLWNAVEQGEKRKDAQLAREFNFALPKELSLAQNTALAREFVQKEFVERGMVADLCIHDHKTPEGEEQPHAHVMLTMREVTEEGFGQKNREWNAKENLCLWRESWAEHANRYLALNGIEQAIDHRTLKEQGIDLIPQSKIGPAVARDHMARFEEHQKIARENGTRIAENPSIALNAITHQQSTFTHHDLAKFINRHTVDTEQFQEVYEKVKLSTEMVSLGLDEQKRERYTTQEMLAIERGMLETVSDLDNFKHDALIGECGSLSSQQKEALEHIAQAGDIKCLVGYAGTGKSYLLNQARETWEQEGYRVLGATLSGIAAENLEGASGIESRTLASRFYHWERGESLTSKDILVIDEAGLIGSRQMARALNEAKAHGAKVVLIGDPEQLQAIEAGAAFRAITEHTGYLELTEIRRQKEAWQQDATKEFATTKTQEALNRYDEHQNIHGFETQAVAKQSLVEMWNETRLNNPDKTQIMLSYTRRDAQELNELARELRKQNGELGEDSALNTARGSKVFATGDRIYFLQNDRDLGVMNGTLGTIDKINNQRVTVRLDKGGNEPEKQKTISFSLEQYNNIDHGYAATIHKAQGVTVDRSYILASKHLDSHATYVGMSRHREQADLFWSKEEFENQIDLNYALSRDRSKDTTLDYNPYKEKPDNQEFKEKSLQKSVSDFVKELVNLGKSSEEKTEEKKRDHVQELQSISRSATSAKEIRELKEQFSRENPEIAKMERFAAMSKDEKKVFLFMERYDALKEKYEYAKEHHRSATEKSVKEQLDRSMYDISKDKKAMELIHRQDRELSKEIEKSSKQMERTKTKELELSL